MTRLAPLALAALVFASCQRDKTVDTDTSPAKGAVVICLSQDATAQTKAEGHLEADELPSLDDFEVEIYNSSAIRLYRKPYSEAKSETILLNSGEYRLVAHHGDTLGAGFGKAYFLADQNFTVHGYIENDKEPDHVSATAKLSNVKLAVKYGPVLEDSYSNYYAVVRHSRYSSKQVKFAKNETRPGFIPAGELYLEVYADRGADAGGMGYYKTDPVQYEAGDFVTFNIEAGERFGDLVVNILVDREVEEFEESITIPSSALPSTTPEFTFSDTEGNDFDYSIVVGPGAPVNDAILNFRANGGLKSVSLTTESEYLTGTAGLPAQVDNVIGAGNSVSNKFATAGITWVALTDATYGLLDFSDALRALSLYSTLANPQVAKFTVTVSDKYDKTATATVTVTGTPVNATISVEDYNIWGWKMVSPVATLTNVDNLSADANIKLQYSADGTSWITVGHTAVNGKKITFADLASLTAGTAYKLRTIFNDDENNVSDLTTLSTEAPAQVGNSGFEEYTAQTFTTDVVLSWNDWNITWWQLYGSDRWWAVNSPVTLNSSCATAYQDYKSFPTVSVISDGAYSGKSIAVATIAIGDATSEVAYGDYHYGAIFIGTANDKNEGDWAKSSEGHAFTSRPSAIEFMHKFNSNGKPYYVTVSILDASGNVIGSAEKNDVSSSVNSWTKVSIPINYSVTNKKAAKIKMEFRSSSNGSDNGHRSVTFTTLSGSHKVHAGNILYLDNIELKYQ
ncbi:MAG: DUF4493 domain-containing protein [Bacteroidales bacterium]|nr:DUF4493 domain-containing protein [Bacteroidales bacterium]